MSDLQRLEAHASPSAPSALAPVRNERLSFWEKASLYLFLVVLIGFGAIVELRSAFMKRHMTDLDVYLKAAWAVRSGGELYHIQDDNGWHYNYPPLLAILLQPLANPPAGVESTGMPAFPLSVAIWYLLSVGSLFLAVHLLANALERSASFSCLQGSQRWSRRWWLLRMVPIIACLPTIGGTLSRGQVNLFVLLLLAGMAAALLRGRRMQAGLWLSAAICIKVIPVFLLLYPLWRRDGRCLAGCTIGLVVGLGLIPLATFGPEKTTAYYQDWIEVLVRPGLSEGGDQSRARELTNITATDSQSFVAILHNTINLDRTTRPTQPATSVRLAHWALGGCFTLLTLLAAGRTRREDGAELLFLGSLILVMLFLSPVSHLHYFCLAIPLVMGFVALLWEKRGVLSFWQPAVLVLIGVNLLANGLPHLPRLEVLRDVGLALAGGILLWSVATVYVWRQREKRQEVTIEKPDLKSLAA